MRLPLIAFCVASIAFGQIAEPLHLQSAVRDKNFYLLSLIERTPEVKKAVEGAIPIDRATLMRAVEQECGPEAECFSATLRFDDEEIATVERGLRRLYRENRAVEQMVDGPLRASGVLARFNDRSGEDLLAEGWIEAAHGINRVLDVYGMGIAPRYPEIDSVSFDVKSPEYGRLVEINAQVLEDDIDSMTLFSSSRRCGLLWR